MYRRLLIFAISLWLTLTYHLPVQSQSDQGLTLALQAQQLYSSGQLTKAATHWQQAATAYQNAGDRLGETNSLINQAQVLQDLGLYPKACNTLLQAFELEHPHCTPEQIDWLIEDLTTGAQAKSRLTSTQGIGLRSLGNVVQKRGMIESSLKLLKLSAEVTRNSPELGATLLALGNSNTTLANQTRDRWNYNKVSEIIDRQDPNLALKIYQPAFAVYHQATVQVKSKPITQTQARLNYLSLLTEIEDWWQQQIERRLKTWQRLEQSQSIEAAANFSNLLSHQLKPLEADLSKDIEANWQNIPPSHQGIYAQINYARSLAKLGQQQKAGSVLQTALHQAQTIQDRLAESYALGYLGQNHSQRGDTATAIALTNRALVLAQAHNINGDAREVTYLWQSQLGKLLEQQGKVSAAINAYTSAFDTLQSLRADLNATHQVVQFDFLQEVKPVYLSLANLLLQSDSHQSLAKSPTSLRNHKNKKIESSPNLELARQVLESLQLAELDNYFQDPCSETADVTQTIDDLDPQAAVIYPILLRDRLEVILSIAGQPLSRFTTPIAEVEVNQTLDLLYDSLYNPSVDNSAVNIFSTTPVDSQELVANTQAVLPALSKIYGWLIQPLAAELANQQIQTLVFVLNGRLQNVPMAALYDGKAYLLESYAIALAPSLQLLNSQSPPRREVKVLAAGLGEQVEVQGNIFPALKNVSQELKQIQSVFPQSLLLLNQEFTTASLKKELQKSFSIVHLATHGVFSSDPNQTFIVTGDRHLIDIDTLSNLLALNSSNKPELIVLSACDTATGDERAILGFAGVAVRSGSSTIASLWSVEDSSTARLMSQFYRQYAQPRTKKAFALRQAQLSLIESLRATPPVKATGSLPPHPYYWAAYVLVGNWQ